MSQNVRRSRVWCRVTVAVIGEKRSCVACLWQGDFGRMFLAGTQGFVRCVAQVAGRWVEWDDVGEVCACEAGKLLFGGFLKYRVCWRRNGEWTVGFRNVEVSIVVGCIGQAKDW